MVVIGGVEQKAHFFALDLSYSDACFVRAYPAAVSETWVDGHVHAFAFFGRVPQSVLYDNDRCLVAKILPDGSRKRTKLFSGFLSHYFIHDRYGRPGNGNDKGAVEGLVGFARRNFMVPIPRFATWAAFNLWLEEQCRKRQADVLRGHSDSIGQRLTRDLDAMMDLPAAPFDACDQATGQVNPQSLVRYKTNDYSVPVAYGHRDVWLRGYVDKVVIGCGGDVIANHPWCWDREDMVFDPVHYLPLLEQKVGALDQAAPMAGWDLPEEFATLRRLMEARMIKAGWREYVQVLRLLETFEMADLHVAIKNALRIGAIGFDAVKHLVLCQVERRPVTRSVPRPICTSCNRQSARTHSRGSSCGPPCLARGAPVMSWLIEDHPAGGLQIAHLVAPRFTARWTTGAFPIEVVREGGFFWTDEGGGPEDATHLYDFVWQDVAPAQDGLAALMNSAIAAIERHIMDPA